MLTSRGACLGSRLFHNGKGRPSPASSMLAHRSFSSSSARAMPEIQPRRILRSNPQPLWASTQQVLRTSVRHASTTPAAPVTPILSEAPLATAGQSVQPVDDWAAQIEALTSSDLVPIIEHLGYLKALGLDYGWGPTALVESLLEIVHVYSGTPWWASIALTAVLVRLAMLKFYINAADSAGRLAVVTPLLKPIKDKMDQAKAKKDQTAMIAAYTEMRAAYKEAGVSFRQMFMPALQIPIGFGTFRLMRGMADLPVPGLESGGLLWIYDLTASDPYYILPLFTSAAFYLTFKRGGELGSQSTMDPMLRKFMLYGLPTLSGFFMLFWPACMQLTFAVTSCLSLTQSTLLRQPRVRAFLKIQPLPPRPGTATQSSPYKGTISRTVEYQPPQPAVEKSLWEKAKATKLNRDIENQNKTKARRASAYEEKRRKELEKEKLEKAARKQQRL